ncbi:TerB family tellurite resistance protein [Pedobacter sp. KBW01]|uniref:TerB family tellurite resistance protein n=1 Tax=Pedobacter sp. KBW01 TaxID=2153364 RepID=UPI001F38F055|nr:TerB family tellurite resistance protein [Pedobacter sp. KBW01]
MKSKKLVWFEVSYCWAEWFAARLKIKGLLLSFAMVLFTGVFMPGKARAQSVEVEQLLINVEKLSQFKNILEDMKKGWEVVSKGYQAVKDISQGNFSLHEVFLDGLMLVSPEVKKYHKVADIITAQGRIVSEYRAALKAFRISGVFRDGELDYFARVYGGLFEQSVANLDALTTVLTASELRMNDDERLKVIDRLFTEVEDQLGFLRSFNGQVVQLKVQRERAKKSIEGLQSVYGQ